MTAVENINPSYQKAESRSEATLQIARKVLQTEAMALDEFSQLLNGDFVDAVDLIENIEGRVIVTGMGKSGHIARKVAATLSSTGTPAFFVHPGEASHGDMGMIVRGDVVIALSNSGEVKELRDLISYSRRFAIPLIGVTKNKSSMLGSESDITLLLPPYPEACPNGLAPTTSTTLTLALGDALAVALLDRKGFTADDFRVYHPGGKLGQQLMKVNEIMHKGEEIPLIRDTALMSEAITVMSDKGFGCVGIVGENGSLTGIVTDGDIRRHVGSDLVNRPVTEIMSPDPKTIKPTALVGSAMGIMNDVTEQFRKITILFVADDAGRPQGILHLHDCLRAGFS
jgi:arabinose-5-phosphate isomerase